MAAATALALTPAGVSPQEAMRAYRAVDGSAGSEASTGAGSDFGSALGRALQNVEQSAQTAETQSTQALVGGGNLTDVVQAVSRAELTLQTATTIRDRVVQAYQDIMKMPI